MGNNKVTISYEEALEMFNGKIAPTIGGTGSDSEPNIQETIISVLIMFHYCQEAFHGKAGGEITKVYENMASYIGTQGYDQRGIETYSGILADTRYLISLMNTIYKNIKYKELTDKGEEVSENSIKDVIEKNPELFNKAINQYGGVKQAEDFELNLTTEVEDGIYLPSTGDSSNLIAFFQQQDKNILCLVECFNKVTNFFESHLSQTDTEAKYLDDADRCLQSMASNIEGIYNEYINSLNILQATVESLSQSNDTFKTMLEDLNTSLARVEIGDEAVYSYIEDRGASDKIATISNDRLAALGPGADGTYRGNQELLASQGEETATNSVTMGGVTYNDSPLSQLTDAEQKDLANYVLSPEKAALVLSGDELQNYIDIRLQNAGSVFNENGNLVYAGTKCNTQEDRTRMLEQYKRNNPNATEKQIQLYDTFLSAVINARENPNDETYRNILMKYTDENGNLDMSRLGLATNYTEVVRNRQNESALEHRSAVGEGLLMPSYIKDEMRNWQIGTTTSDLSNASKYNMSPESFASRCTSEQQAAQYAFNYDMVHGNVKPEDAKSYISDPKMASSYETYYNSLPLYEMQKLMNNPPKDRNENPYYLRHDSPDVQALNEKYGFDVYQYYLDRTGIKESNTSNGPAIYKDTDNTLTQAYRDQYARWLDYWGNNLPKGW